MPCHWSGWDGFFKYEAVNYPDSGKQAFWYATHSEECLQTLHAYGAYEGKRLIGVIVIRNEGRYISLFFVDGNFIEVVSDEDCSMQFWKIIFQKRSPLILHSVLKKFMSIWDWSRRVQCVKVMELNMSPIKNVNKRRLSLQEREMFSPLSLLYAMLTHQADSKRYRILPRTSVATRIAVTRQGQG